MAYRLTFLHVKRRLHDNGLSIVSRLFLASYYYYPIPQLYFKSALARILSPASIYDFWNQFGNGVQTSPSACFQSLCPATFCSDNSARETPTLISDN